MDRSLSELPIAIIGAGPVGLAAASQLRIHGRDLVVLEAGGAAGAGIAKWGHVRLFTPWREIVDTTSRTLLGSSWVPPDPGSYPTGSEFVSKYLRALAESPALRDTIRYEARVESVSRAGYDKVREQEREHVPFELVINTRAGVERVQARAVIDASGTTTRPNPLGSSGVPAPGEIECRDGISYGVPDILGQASRFANRRILVVGSGHSAQNVILDLVRLRREHPRTTVIWGVRGESLKRLVGGGASDPIPRRARLGTEVEQILGSEEIELRLGLEVDEVRPSSGGIEVVTALGDTVLVDHIISATGFRPDATLLSELRLNLDPALECPVKLAPLIDPRFHWCGSVPEHGVTELSHPEQSLFVIGMKSYGRAPTFLLKTGYKQVRSVVATITGTASADMGSVSASLPITCETTSPLPTGGGCGPDLGLTNDCGRTC